MCVIVNLAILVLISHRSSICSLQLSLIPSLPRSTGDTKDHAHQHTGGAEPEEAAVRSGCGQPHPPVYVEKLMVEWGL